MAVMVTRAEIQAARHPDCGWSVEALHDAIAERFPGAGPVDLEALIDSWLAEPTRNPGEPMLGQASMLAAKLMPAPVPPALHVSGSLMFGRKALQRLKAALQPPEEE